MKCLVLGASGFIGSHLTYRLTSCGIEVITYGRKANISIAKLPLNNVRHIQGDFATETEWERILEDVDICFHLISTTVPKSSNDSPIWDVESNVIGTLRLLEALKRSTSRLIFSSSGGTIYGAVGDKEISEQYPTNPLCSYGITKLTIEKYLSLYRELYGIDSVSLRIANPYGPGQRPNNLQGAVGVFIGRILRGHTIDIWGDGSVVRDYIFIDDVVTALIAAANYHGRNNVFNIGSGTGVSLLQLIKAIEDVTNKTADIIRHPSRGFDVQRNVLDISLAESELAWKPSIALTVGLQETAKWMDQQLAQIAKISKKL